MTPERGTVSPAARESVRFDRAIEVAPGPAGHVLSHAEGPWGPRARFVLALTECATEVGSRQAMSELLRRLYKGAGSQDVLAGAEVGTATAVAWGAGGRIRWAAHGAVWVAIVGGGLTRVLHAGEGTGGGRAELQVGQTLVVASAGMVEGVGQDHVVAELDGGVLTDRAREVMNQARQLGLRGPRALLAIRSTTNLGPAPAAPLSVPTERPRARWPSLLSWGAVGMLLVLVVAFVVPRLREAPSGDRSTVASQREPESPPPGSEEVWEAAETYPAGEEIWRFRAGRAITSSPLCEDGRVYFGSRDGQLYCLDARSGDVVWAFDAGDGIGSSPTSGGDAVFAGCYDGRLYAVSKAQGQEIWHVATGGAVRCSPAYWNELVFFGSGDSCVYAVAAASGRVRWKWRTGGAVWARPVVASGYVIVGSTDGVVYCYDAVSGAPVWDYDAGAAVYGAVCVTGDSVYVGCTGDFLYCLALSDATVHWRVAIPGGVHGTPGLSGGLVVIGSLRGTLYALDAKRGEQRWEFPTGGELRSSPLVLGGTVYAGSYDTYLYAVEGRKGTETWRFCVGSPIYSSPCSCDGLVFVGSNGGTLFALGVGEAG